MKSLPYIRKARLEDFEKILEINKRHFIFEKKYTETFNPNWPFTQSGKEYFIKKFVNDRAINLVLIDNNIIIGYLFASVTFNDVRTINPIAEIDSLFIDEDYRNRGLGSKLFNEFKRLAKNQYVRRLRVTTYFDNQEAINFYKKHKFKELGVVLEQDFI